MLLHPRQAAQGSIYRQDESRGLDLLMGNSPTVLLAWSWARVCADWLYEGLHRVLGTSASIPPAPRILR